MNKKKTIYGTVSFVVIVLILWFTWHFVRKPDQIVETRPLISDVTVAVIIPTEVNDYFEASGIIKANNTSEIASRIMGTIRTIAVHQGQSVSAGQELLTIDNKDLIQRLNAAQASYDEAVKNLEVVKENNAFAETTYNRYKALIEQNAVSKQEYDQVENKKKVADLVFALAQTQVIHAQSALAEAKVNLSYAEIVAPANGIITNKFVDIGSMANPGSPLLTVEDVTKFKIEANLNEHLSSIVKTGMSVEIIVDSIGLRFNSPITEIVPSIDPQGRSFVIKCLFVPDPNIPFKSGLYARVLVPMAKKTALIVPITAIISKGQLTGVYVSDDTNTVSYRLIRIGKTFGDAFEVLSGLESGDKVIVNGTEHAIDGGMLAINNNM